MSKMDRQGVRTAAELERKYQFGKSFSEVLGVALDAQTHAVNAENAVETLKKEVGELSILLKDEETGLLGIIEAKLDTDKLVSQFNLAFNEITIKSDNFELTAEGKITAENGSIAGWDISKTSIFKNTGGALVQITAPESEESDFITVALLENDVVKKMPLSVRANGDIYTNGKIVSSNESNTKKTEIDNGHIVSNSGEIAGWVIDNDSFVFDCFVSENVLHSVVLSSKIYNPNNQFDIETAMSLSKSLYINRSDGNGTKEIFYIRPNGEFFLANYDNANWFKVQTGLIFMQTSIENVSTDDGPTGNFRIPILYFIGAMGEQIGMFVNGHYEYDEEGAAYSATYTSIDIQ